MYPSLSPHTINIFDHIDDDNDPVSRVCRRLGISKNDISSNIMICSGIDVNLLVYYRGPISLGLGYFWCTYDNKGKILNGGGPYSNGWTAKHEGIKAAERVSLPVVGTVTPHC